MIRRRLRRVTVLSNGLQTRVRLELLTPRTQSSMVIVVDAAWARYADSTHTEQYE